METAQTADYALRVLIELARRDGQTMSELADSLGINRSVAHRIVTTLRRRAGVIRDTSGRFYLGPLLVALGERLDHELATVGASALADLARVAGETAIISVREGDHSIVIASVPGYEGTLRVEYEVGFRQPLNRGASSLAILAHLDEEVIRRLADPLVAEALPGVRATGIARTAGQIRNHMVGIAAPILNSTGTVLGSVTLIAPESRSPQLDLQQDPLHAAARAIGAAYEQRLRQPTTAQAGRRGA